MGPQHGDRGADGGRPPKPRGFTVAMSREAGARGGSIARRLSRELGWPIYNADSLDYLIRDDDARKELLLGEVAREWADAQTLRLTVEGKLVAGSETAEVIRLMLAIAARGEAIIVGRGAGYVLPAASTLHVRVTAPWADRVGYMADWLRLTPQEAEAEVRMLDRKRDMLAAAFGAGREVNYDLVLNSASLGEDACAAVIVAALKARKPADDPSDTFEPL